MSESLREALEPLIAASEAQGARIDFQLARFRTMLAQQEADLPISAAHPVEPAPVQVEVTDEARAAGLAALYADPEWHKSDGAGLWRANYQRAAELVLEAALPHLRIVQQGGEQ